MKKKFDYIVYIGRFQPLHNAHVAIIEEALETADRVIILIGSHNEPRTIKNPWTSNERHELIQRAIGLRCDQATASWEPLVAYIADRKYNDQQWAKDIQNAVSRLIVEDLEMHSRNHPLNVEWATGKLNPRIGIIGHLRDDSSEYLEMFPQWKFIAKDNIGGIRATDIRQAYFDPFHGAGIGERTTPEEAKRKNDQLLKDHLPEIILRYLMEWRASHEYARLQDEYEFIKTYKGAWQHAPYPPTFVTTDAVVVQSGHVLLVKRKAHPGQGLWALPGGFVNQDERIEDAMTRELREETKLKVPEPVLKGSIKDSKVFDYPFRSLRGRTITHAHLIELKDGSLPKVKGGDDADKARWVPLSEFEGMQEVMFEDHYDIVHYFLGQV